MERRLFTSESVTEGHPDKVCDIISDSVLSAIYEKDPNARVACETFATTGIITVTNPPSFTSTTQKGVVFCGWFRKIWCFGQGR